MSKSASCFTLEFNSDFIEATREKIKGKNGFNIVDYQLKFYGYCKECQITHPEYADKE